ncbi:RDD family protein [Galbibacter pacificus]|uniref:RDD family protein n=1 Tax=Galbibacter pacificus TaxID=2996052 RepID=A0ABT6FRH8_9FLAO|nr:RDD family protein [Galbibacter pacificus]MDG3581666.1 RDD family protein [Galbibacter pacificus]MDG3585860.1 RDD family protein [Galbibacter pacificus]
MSELQINTTQNVNIMFTAASVGERILAYGIDFLIKIAYASTIGYVIFNVLGLWDIMKQMDQWSQAAIIIVFLLPIIFYTLIFESVLEGQTIGKKVVKIKVVKIDGYQASFPDYIVRWFFRIIDINMMSGIIGLVSIIISDKNQRLGDITAGTSVISLKDKVTIDHTILENLKEDYKPTYPQVIKLSDNDARIIKETFERARLASDHKMMLKLKKKIVEVTGITPVHNETHTFVRIVLKDYNYYTQHM